MSMKARLNAIEERMPTEKPPLKVAIIYPSSDRVDFLGKTMPLAEGRVAIEAYQGEVMEVNINVIDSDEWRAELERERQTG